MQTTPILKRPVSYYGGNEALINHILPLIPWHDVYTEDLAGGATTLFAKEPVPNETLNDTLDVCINFYEVLKTRYAALKKLIDRSLYSRTLHKQATAIVLGTLPADNLYRAWAFWYAANFSFSHKLGGGIRYSNEMTSPPQQVFFNKKNQFTELLSERLQKVMLENTDALKVLKSRNVKNAFHFQHPPYPGADQGHYKGYTFDDLKALLTWNAEECKGKFLLNIYNSDMLTEFIQVHGWHKKEVTHRIKAPRKSGPAKVEVLVWNYDYTKNTRDLFNNH